MKGTTAARKIPACCCGGAVSGAAAKIGAVVTTSMFSPACAAEQIEHVWCDAVEVSACV